MKRKKEVGLLVKNFFNFLKTQFNGIVIRFRTDNAPEYNTQILREIYDDLGIIHETTAPYNPQQLGRSERINRTIENCTKTLLKAANLNMKFWPLAIDTAIKIKNMLPHAGINYEVSDTLWYGNDHKPDYNQLKSFGCFVTFDRMEGENKMEKFKKYGVFVGYTHNKTVIKYQIFKMVKF